MTDISTGNPEEILRKKVELSIGGPVRLPAGFVMPFRISHSTAGPGAGMDSAAFSFEGLRVKKSISYTHGEFELAVRGDGRYALTRGGEPFLEDVAILPIVRHCPEQAFFNLDPRCMFHCVYCGSPLLDMSEDKHLSTDRIMGMLRESMASGEVKAVSFTSGVVGSVRETVERMAEAVAAVRREYPDMPIGVEPYVSTVEDLRILHDAGAEEIKINIEAARSDLFEKTCPDLNYEGIWDMLKCAVSVFGRGKVISNIIVGLGESDADLELAMDRLSSMGVVPSIRALRITSLNRVQIEAAVGSLSPVTPERMMLLAVMQKKCMERHGFTTMTSRTMCSECGCCDLVPFRDF